MKLSYRDYVRTSEGCGWVTGIVGNQVQVMLSGCNKLVWVQVQDCKRVPNSQVPRGFANA